MKKLLIFPVLGLVFFPLLTSAQSSDSQLCQDCLISPEYMLCVGGETCYNELGDDLCRETSDSCDSLYGPDWANGECQDSNADCFENCDGDEEYCENYCEEQRESCVASYVPLYNSCVSSCQFNDCGLGICLPMSGGEGGDSGDGGHGSAPIVGGVLDGTQLSNMGTALTNGGSSLLRIGIQLMPYAIALTIIFICFHLIVNRTNFRTRDNGKSKFGRKYDDFMYEQYMDSYRGWRDEYYIPGIGLTEEEASKRSTKRKMRKEYKKRRKEHGLKWYQGRI